MKLRSEKRLMGASVLSAIAASLCCITPVLALLSGAGGLASALSWMEPARPWLIVLSGGLLGFAWYQKLKPGTAAEIQCACENDEKSPFVHGKIFLGIVTVLAVLMMAFPWYSGLASPASWSTPLIVPADQIETVTFHVEGMSCAGCELHIEHAVGGLHGVVDVKADFRSGNAVVRFDRTVTSDEEIRRAIDVAGYAVTGQEETQ